MATELLIEVGERREPPVDACNSCGATRFESLHSNFKGCRFCRQSSEFSGPIIGESREEKEVRWAREKKLAAISRGREEEVWQDLRPKIRELLRKKEA